MASSNERPTTEPELEANAQSEELPDYEDTPGYSADNFHHPLLTYHLRATKTNTWNLVPFGPATSSSGPQASYEIQYRSAIALPIFKRKADISISRTWLSSEAPSTGPVARADFHNKGPLPYCPRARITLTSSSASPPAIVELSSKDWKNWAFIHAGAHYIWTLRTLPACFELSATTATATTTTVPPVIARFTYGKVGTKVLPGGEVGRLEMWRDALTEEEGVIGRELVVAGCLVVVRYFMGLGRQLRNEEEGNGGGAAAAALINPAGRLETKIKGNYLF